MWAKRWEMARPRPGRLAERRTEFVGLTLGAAEEAASQTGLRVRIFGPPTDTQVAFKADFNPNRLNLLVRNGMVVDAATG
jgi:hypothetical protein